MEEWMTAHRVLAGIFYKPYRDIIWRLPDNDFPQGVRESTPRKGNSIYLTFDDGPCPPVTKRVLGLLKELKTPATFFLSGENILAHRREIKKLNYKSHGIGSHFFHHIPAFALSSKKIFQELDLTDRLIEQNFGRDSQLFRPPYGIFGPALLKALRKQNKKMVLWSLMANDFKWSSEKVIRHLKKSVQNGDVVVFHDSLKTERVMLEVLPQFIQDCREKGLDFESIR